MRKIRFDRQYKIAALTLVLEDGMPVSEVAKELSIHYNSLYRWISEYEEYGESAFPRQGCALYNYQYEVLNREIKKIVAFCFTDIDFIITVYRITLVILLLQAVVDRALIVQIFP